MAPCLFYLHAISLVWLGQAAPPERPASRKAVRKTAPAAANWRCSECPRQQFWTGIVSDDIVRGPALRYTCLCTCTRARCMPLPTCEAKVGRAGPGEPGAGARAVHLHRTRVHRQNVMRWHVGRTEQSCAVSLVRHSTSSPPCGRFRLRGPECHCPSSPPCERFRLASSTQRDGM